MKKKIKKIINNLLLNENIMKMVKKYSEGLGTVFMLHNINDKTDGNGLMNEGMKISPKYLEKNIKKLINLGYEFISLDTLSEKLEKNNFQKKFIVFTLDDGYMDNFTIAYPIFKKYNIPFAIYITTSLPDKKAIMWWYVIEDIIMNNDFVETSDGNKYTCETLESKQEVFCIIREKIHSRQAKKFKVYP